ANRLSGSGVAVSVTVGTEKVASQVAPQSTPAGSDTTEPVPVPSRATVSVATPVPTRVAAAPPPGSADTVSDAPCTSPTAAGANATVIVQVAPAPSVAGQSLALMRKSAVSLSTAPSVPVAESPMFLTVNCDSFGVPSGVRLKLCDVGVMVSMPAFSAVPVAIAVSVVVPSVTVSVAALAPGAPAGAN